jgi:glycosyltransferase involved in cell wall biosynthesis
MFRNNNTLRLDKEFDRVWEKIKNNENFALARYADGEYAIMSGKQIQGVDGWTSTDYVSKLGQDCLNSLSIVDENYIYGIACPCCDREAYYWITSRLPEKATVSFSNIFVNRNYSKFINKFEKLKKDAVIIANEKARDKQIGSLNILKFYGVGKDCVEFWEQEGENLLNKIKEEVGNLKDKLFVISAGPMSEPIIYELYKHNPNNTYIDVGSAIDKYIHENETRTYRNLTDSTAQKVCTTFDNSKMDFSVSVVLNLYKRPNNLEKQFELIEKQTLKPKEIILFKDETDPVSNIEIPESIKDKFSLKILISKNVGVWGRFSAALLSKSTYVCVFDDDTMPGHRWLENCHSSMLKKEGLYGTVGILMEKPKKYPFEKYIRIGWLNPNKHSVEVDLVGHSWFFKRDWLGVLWINSSKLYNFKVAGEDMFFSHQLKKYLNIPTFVPPHPKMQYDLYGSNPELANKLGKDEAALSMNSDNLTKMNEAVKHILNDKFKPLIFRNPLKYFWLFKKYSKVESVSKG